MDFVQDDEDDKEDRGKVVVDDIPDEGGFTKKSLAEAGEIRISSTALGKDNAAVLRRRVDDDGKNVVDAEELAKLVSDYSKKEKQASTLKWVVIAAVPTIIILLLTSFASAWLAVSLHNDLETDNDSNQLRNTHTNEAVSTRTHNQVCTLFKNPDFEQRYRALKQQEEEQEEENQPEEAGQDRPQTQSRALQRLLEMVPQFYVPAECMSKTWELVVRGDVGQGVQFLFQSEEENGEEMSVTDSLDKAERSVIMMEGTNNSDDNGETRRGRHKNRELVGYTTGCFTGYSGYYRYDFGSGRRIMYCPYYSGRRMLRKEQQDNKKTASSWSASSFVPSFSLPVASRRQEEGEKEKTGAQRELLQTRLCRCGVFLRGL